MKQWEAVVETLEKLGGIATLGEINHNVFSIKNCERNTKTPFASIRRIVRQRPDEIYRIKPGLYGLVKYKKLHEKQGYKIITSENKNDISLQQINHYYYQGLLVEIGNLQSFQTYIPPQDKNRFFLNQKLSDIASLDKMYNFGYKNLIRRAKTIDVIRFNERNMPSFFYEVEHSTDIQNSLLKFVELQDFNSKFVIVSDEIRRNEYNIKLSQIAFKNIKDRINFLSYEQLTKYHTKTYEYFTIKNNISIF